MDSSIYPDVRRNAGVLAFTVLMAVLISFAIFLGINFTGTLTSNNRHFSVVLEANQEHLLDQDKNWTNDMFTECMIFYMQMIRDENKIMDIFSSRLQLPVPHPCDSIRLWLESTDRSFHGWVETRRFYGTRHIYSILVRLFSIAQIRSACLFLTLFSP